MLMVAPSGDEGTFPDRNQPDDERIPYLLRHLLQKHRLARINYKSVLLAGEASILKKETQDSGFYHKKQQGMSPSVSKTLILGS